MSVSAIVFWIIAAVILGSAISVVTAHNLVHAAFFMVLTFFGVSGLYVLLEADFLAVVQILIYVGAVAVLIVFGVMLTQRKEMAQTNAFSRHKWVAAFLVILLQILFGYAVTHTPWLVVDEAAPDTTVGLLGEMMLTELVIPFEAVGILLLVAVVGAIILTKGARRIL
ncbi:MAG: NADH-quinone oxidoreductase subunit J [Syntrophomonadaceae bacterium]|nr:NADH-quinone oxidoreductase subunit J [Syntrophomonadaceae bacterium]